MYLQNGTTVGQHHTILKPLGVGGQASVYLARHEVMGKLQALKVLNIPDDHRLKSRLIREGQILYSMEHPHILPVHDAFEHNGALVLVMRYIEGPDLKRWMSESSPALADQLRIFCQICDAVGHAHRAGIIHRDLKPSNVLLEFRDGAPHARVADFGTARGLDADELGLTQTRGLLGTPCYMAPEQLENARDIDRRADIFSLGCVLYEMVTGARAFPGESIIDIIDALRSCRYIPPERLVRDLPENIRQAIQGAIVLKPADRLGSCDELLGVLDGTHRWRPPTQFSDETLEELLELPAPPEPVPPEKPPAAPPIKRSSPPWRALAGITVLLASIGSAPMWFPDTSTPRAEHAAEPPDEEPAVEPTAEPAEPQPEAPPIGEPVELDTTPSTPVAHVPSETTVPPPSKASTTTHTPVTLPPETPPVTETLPVTELTAASVTLSNSGDATVSLRSGGTHIPLPGEVPPGTYSIIITPKNGAPYASGELSVSGEEPWEIQCNNLGICAPLPR